MAVSEGAGRARRARIAGLGFVALLGFAVAALLVGGGGAGACAPPSPGYRSVTPLWMYLWFLAPAVVTFLVSAYVALGIRNLFLRWLALIPCLGLAWLAAFVALTLMPFSCGEFVLA